MGENASFKGPCAVHDRCYATHGYLYRRVVCDPQLENNINENCDDTYGYLNSNRYACEEAGGVYALAVEAVHLP